MRSLQEDDDRKVEFDSITFYMGIIQCIVLVFFICFINPNCGRILCVRLLRGVPAKIIRKIMEKHWKTE